MQGGDAVVLADAGCELAKLCEGETAKALCHVSSEVPGSSRVAQNRAALVYLNKHGKLLL